MASPIIGRRIAREDGARPVGQELAAVIGQEEAGVLGECRRYAHVVVHRDHRGIGPNAVAGRDWRSGPNETMVTTQLGILHGVHWSVVVRTSPKRPGPHSGELTCHLLEPGWIAVTYGQAGTGQEVRDDRQVAARLDASADDRDWHSRPRIARWTPACDGSSADRCGALAVMPPASMIARGRPLVASLRMMVPLWLPCPAAALAGKPVTHLMPNRSHGRRALLRAAGGHGATNDAAGAGAGRSWVVAAHRRRARPWCVRPGPGALPRQAWRRRRRWQRGSAAAPKFHPLQPQIQAVRPARREPRV